jgi:hypothetical protein
MIIYFSSVFFGKLFHGISKIVQCEVVKGSPRNYKFLRSYVSCNKKGMDIHELQQEGHEHPRVASRREHTSMSCSKKGTNICEFIQTSTIPYHIELPM